MTKPTTELLTTERLSVFLENALKPDEISGDQSDARIEELLGWFKRFFEGNANPKWAKAHTAELAYALTELLASRTSPATEAVAWDGAAVRHGSTYDEAGKAAWDFVRPTLLERGREKGYAGVWSDGFRQGWQSAERAIATPQPVAVKVREALEAIRELNMTGVDENGHRWSNSDLIDQEIIAALSALSSGDAS